VKYRAAPRFRWLTILALLGPGLISANAGNDAGGIATYASVGAQYGYSLLWAMILTAIALIMVQEMAARMGAATGKGLADLIRENFGPRWTVLAMGLLFIANAGITTSEFAGIAAALELFGLSKYLTVPLVAVSIWILVVRGSYQRVERIFLALTVAFFAYPIAAFLAHPDWPQVGRQLITPTIQPDSQYLLLVVAMVGTTISPYLQFFIQASVVEKGVTERQYALQRLEVIIGSAFSILIAMFIIIATAATLYQVSPGPLDNAAEAARALEPLAGPFASVLFAVGLFGASMLAAGVLPLSTAFAITEAFGWEGGVSRELSEAPVFYGLFTGLIVLGALVTLIPGLPLFTLLVLVQVLNGILLPVMLVFIVRLANNAEVMGSLVNRPWYGRLAWLVTLVVGLLALTLVLVGTVLPLFGLTL
jgi:NRAMP (natural resistance-associated macrophage protein)-like metal ion transporter